MVDGEGVFVKEKYICNDLLKPKTVYSRLYQTRILESAKKQNTLVVLPTALGKTIIGLLLAIERLRYGRILFLAPTKPLVRQHHKTFTDKSLFDDEELIVITGNNSPLERKSLYYNGKIVFATPQCINNDLKRNIFSLQDFSLIIFDEAHRARGKYAYVGIAQYYFNQSLNQKILALTASPGGYKSKIVDICSNLGIEKIEFRTDDDLDVKHYIHPIDVTWKRIKLPDTYLKVRDHLKVMLIEKVKAIRALGALTYKKPAYINRKDLVELNQDLQRRIKNGESGYIYNLKILATAAISVAHMVELVESQGHETLSAFIENSLTIKALDGSRGHKLILNDPLFIKIKIILDNCKDIANPKIVELIKLVTDQLKIKCTSRFLIFTQYRDTVKNLISSLKKHENINPGRFIGQSEKEFDPGMKQNDQKIALDKFRKGTFNVLVATSIAEEGLDIPEVDHVIFYEPVPSGIRYIQRRGRTGRKMAGKVTIIMAEKTIDETYYWVSVARTKKMKKIISELNRSFPKKTKKPDTTITLSHFQSTDNSKAKNLETKEEFWNPQSVQLKGLTPVINWLNENLPDELISIADIVKLAYDEGGIEKKAIESAIWRLIHKGQLYQPESGKIRKTHFE